MFLEGLIPGLQVVGPPQMEGSAEGREGGREEGRQGGRERGRERRVEEWEREEGRDA